MELTADQSAAIARWLTITCPALSAEAKLTSGKPVWTIRLALAADHFMFLRPESGGWRRPAAWKYSIYTDRGQFADQGPFQVAWQEEPPNVSAARIAERLAVIYDGFLTNPALPASFQAAAVTNLPSIVRNYVSVRAGRPPDTH